MSETTATACTGLTHVIEKAHVANTLDVLKLGVVITRADGRILHANRVAREMMREGGSLRDCGGVLRAREPAAHAKIKRAIQLAARDRGAKTGLVVRLTNDGEPVVVAHVRPLAGCAARSHLDPAAAVAVFVGNPADDDESIAQTVATTFRLTPTETRVLSRLLSGNTIAEVAANLGVAATTVRTHLDSIFAKTGVSRQSELIRLAARIGPPNL